jgi:hypothetical protein
MKQIAMSLTLISTLAACSTPSPAPNATAPAPGAATSPAAPGPDPLAVRIARFAPVEIGADMSALPANERQALTHLVRAAQVMDALFLEQVWAGNEAMLFDLLRDDSAAGKARLHYFVINKGPWSRLDHNEAFLPGAPAKPPQANFYPAGARKEEVDTWLQSLPPAEKARATGFFTTIRRSPDGTFTAVPYSTEYQGGLEIAATHLRAAAQATTQPTLKAFLEARADAFRTNDSTTAT